MTEISAAAIEQQLAAAKQRKKVGRRYFWFLLASLGILIVVVPLVMYVAWTARARQLLREQLDQAKARNEPITTAELTAWHAVPTGERDITPLWLAAIEPFDSAAYNAAVAKVPHVGGSGGELPPLDQPWADPAVVQTYLSTYERELTALHAVAKEKGAVRYPRQFSKGIAMLIPDAQKARSAARALQLQFHQQLRDKDTGAALENVDTQAALGQTLHHDPFLISLLIRVAIESGTLKSVQQAAEVLPLTDAELAHLQTVVRQLDIQQQYEDAFLGERAMVYHGFHLPITMLSGQQFPSGAVTDMETSYDVSRVSRPEDCAMALRILSQYLDAAKKGPPASLEEVDVISEEFKASVASASPWERFRYAQTNLLIPAMGAASQADARFRAQRDLTDVLLALRRFELKHGKLPNELSELVPDFMPTVPLDPFDGQPLRILIKEGSAAAYSIGKDRIDNSGASDSNGLEPDLLLELKTPR